MAKKEHLPLFGVGPVIVFGQIGFTAAVIILANKFKLNIPNLSILKIPFIAVGIILIVFGFYLNWSAKRKSMLFKNVEENKLITDGVYSIVRNPVYSCALLICTGAVLITNNLLLLAIPVICWLYTSIFLIFTEEKWLLNLYGKEYEDYCKKVNRCIPWFPKRGE